MTIKQKIDEKLEGAVGILVWTNKYLRGLPMAKASDKESGEYLHWKEACNHALIAMRAITNAMRDLSYLPDAEFHPAPELLRLGLEMGYPADAAIYITDAPVDYDGFGTTTVQLLPYKPARKRGRIRKVAIPPKAIANDWQYNRYRSGNHLCIPESEMDRWVGLWEENPLGEFLMFHPSVEATSRIVSAGDLREAAREFKRLVWHDPDDGFLDSYGDWQVFEMLDDGATLKLRGLVKDGWK
jgi:hypothetical protein